MLHSEIGIYWHNFKTGETEYLTAAPTERMAEFIPQSRAAQLLYEINLKLGKTPLDAAIEVLEAATRGEKRAGAGPPTGRENPEGH